ncbi:ribosomal protein S18 acetylase RimI-like enzyme [Ensifer sp. 4252]
MNRRRQQIAVPVDEEAHFGRQGVAFARGGVGRALVEHAVALHPVLTVDVNEQNLSGAGFYARLGFETTGRSPVDDDGRPYPLLHLRRS